MMKKKHYDTKFYKINQEIKVGLQLNIFHVGFGFMMELFFMLPYQETPKKGANLIIYVQ